MEQKRKFINVRDLVVLLAVLALAGGYLLYNNWKQGRAEDANYAVVSLDGAEIMRFYLGDYETMGSYVSLQEAYGVPVNFELRDGAIRFVDVVCPDHICEQYGYIQHENQTAVCLPNRTVVSVYTPDEIARMG